MMISKRQLMRPQVILVILAIILCLTSCTPTITQMGYLEKDVSPEYVVSALDKKPKYAFLWKDTPGINELVYVYAISAGSSNINNYYLYFINDKLDYWGYPHEFARSDDPLLNAIGQKTTAKIDKKKEEEFSPY